MRTAVTTKSARTPEVMFRVLGTVDDVVVAVADRAGAQMPDIAAAAGSVIAREPIICPARVGRAHRSICAGSPATIMCGNAIPCVNSDAYTPPAAPRSAVLRRRRSSIQITTRPADLLGEHRSQQPQFGRRPVQRPRQFTVAFPLILMRQNMFTHEITHGLPQRQPLRRVPPHHLSAPHSSCLTFVVVTQCMQCHGPFETSLVPRIGLRDQDDGPLPPTHRPQATR